MKRLIEEWLPVAEIGSESARERRSMTALPPIYYLHVWWARRPLVASRAAVLASILPADVDKKKFMHLLGIHGDPISAHNRIKNAKRTGENLGTNIYGYSRAFCYTPTITEIEWLLSQTRKIHPDNPTILDSTAGGGSIPFEALRLGLNTFANDLNPVACIILKQTLEAPIKYGNKLLQEYERITKEFIKKAESKYKDIFPSEPNGNLVDGYLYARTITCPYCSGIIPLSPNWKLSPDGIGVRLIPNPETKICQFEIVSKTAYHSAGTVTRGDALCPYPGCGRVTSGNEVKRQAQNGEMGEILFAVVYKEKVTSTTKTGKSQEKWVRKYRAPNENDDNTAYIKARLEDKLIEWLALDIVPSENVPQDINDDRPIQYGMPFWRDLFSPRQLLCHGTSVEVFRELLEEEQNKGELDDITKAAFIYLSFALSKLLNWNAILSSWNVEAERLRSVFDRHDFAFKWSYAEMAPLVTGIGYDWAIEQTGKCISELIQLTCNNRPNSQQLDLFATSSNLPPTITITNNSADNLIHIEDHSIDAVIIDPPYYDNVMYAELSDFFYVWLKRTAGYVYPEFFTRFLTDKENEAVANPAKFPGEKGAKAKAAEDYTHRMAAIFSECKRVLKPEGILTLMFTHKAQGAWDALATGLLEAGFTITASWPINTEAEGSLHIKDKAAAKSTIFLVCRPRVTKPTEDPLYWEDVEKQLTLDVRKRVKEFQNYGIKGVDLYLSCFGPALEKLSQNWPITRGTPSPQPLAKSKSKQTVKTDYNPYSVTPEDALEAARSTVKQWRLEQILDTLRQTHLDAITEWFVLAWDTFKSPRFPYDEANSLAKIVGLEVDKQIVNYIAQKQSSDIILYNSSDRATKGCLGKADGSHAMIDALHHAAYRARSHSLEAALELLKTHSLIENPDFQIALQAVLEVLPVSSTYTKIEEETSPISEAALDFDVLESLRRLVFAEKVKQPKQLELWLS